MQATQSEVKPPLINIQYLSKIFNKYTYHITLKDVEKTPNNVIKAGIPLQTRLLKPEDIEEYLQVKESNKKSPVMKRLKMGYVCWCAFHNQEIMAYVWRGTNKVYVKELKTSIKLPEGYYYACEAYTRPEYRGMGVFKELLTSWNIYAKNNYEYKKSIAIVHPDNEPAIRGALATGQEIIGSIETRIFLGVPIHKAYGNDGYEELINQIFIEKT